MPGTSSTRLRGLTGPGGALAEDASAVAGRADLMRAQEGRKTVAVD